MSVRLELERKVAVDPEGAREIFVRRREGVSMIIGPLPADKLRWICDPASLRFASTAEVEPASGVIGQDSAVEALRFGLETRAAGQNVFVRGLVGTGRLTLVRQLMEEIKTACQPAPDRCYVHNFSRPDRPRLITLPAGRAHLFRRRVDRLADYIRDELRKGLDTESVRSGRIALEARTQERIDAVVKPFEEALGRAGLAMSLLQDGAAARPVILPVLAGRPVGPEELEQARASGAIDAAAIADMESRIERFRGQIGEVAEKVNGIRRAHLDELRELYESQARSLLDRSIKEIHEEFPSPEVHKFLQEVADDVVENRLARLGTGVDSTPLYRVNVILAHEERDSSCPIVVETAPTLKNLLGTVDYEIGPEGRVRSNHMMIAAGSILRADKGFLILDARDVLSEPGAWRVLLRTLKTGRLEITPPEMTFPWSLPSLAPEPIEVDVKVILIGDYEIFAPLDRLDADFPHLFKVLVDFDSTIQRNEQGIALYAGVLARIVGSEKLPPFDASAVAALAEHGARIAAHGGKLTARFGRLADIAREAAYLSAKEGRERVSAPQVREAVTRSKRRSDLPSRIHRSLVSDGTIRISVGGRSVGQVNGLAVLEAGPLTYGFPARITATIGPGTTGVINIEREASLSGAIHTKGFYILGGVLRTLLRTDHPLAFNASIAFEQSYGGIDGDSASAAEVCCLLSALTETPLRQEVAMTGAIDQMGNVLAVGAVNEKIEGFYDTCVELGLDGSQGVIIPAANTGDLMLRWDVLEAAKEGRFRVWAVSTINESLEILTGLPAGERGVDGRYPDGSLLAIAMRKAEEYWRKAVAVVSRAET